MLSTKTTAVVALALLISVFPVTPASAETTLIISGNGDSSDSEVQINIQTQTSVEQSNETSVENNVNSSSNTGNNSASENASDEQTIQTGDVSSSTQIENSNISENTASQEQSSAQATIEVTQNGSSSTNTVDLHASTSTQSTQVNNTIITNLINSSSNTGNNSSNKNTGKVNISTGNIISEITLRNAQIGTSHVTQGQCCDEVVLKIKNNGSDSTSIINININSLNESITTNSTQIDNFIIEDLNTGENSADKNIGEVAIVTGDISSDLLIENSNINTNDVGISGEGCCDQEEPPNDDPEDPQDPSDPTPDTPVIPPSGGIGGTDSGNGSSSSSSSSGTANVLAVAAGSLLPATGSNYLFFATIANLLMFLLGAYLRLRSGRNPSLALAV